MSNQTDERNGVFIDDPLVNILSRRLAWASVMQGRGMDELETGILVKRVRHELGIPLTGDAYDNSWFAKNTKLIRQQTEEKRKVAHNWRILSLPSHLTIRTLAVNPIVKQLDLAVGEKLAGFRIAFTDPSIPSLKIYVGKGKIEKTVVELINRRAIYMLLHDVKYARSPYLYVGKADVASDRMPQHEGGKLPYFYFLAFPDDTQQNAVSPQFNGDILDATESLMIGFWSEIAQLSNSNFGTTYPPASRTDLHIAILYATAISAAYLYTVRELATDLQRELALVEGIQIPFLNSQGKEKPKGWPDCYINADPDGLLTGQTQLSNE